MTVLTAWQERKRKERLHIFLEEKAPLWLVPCLQAQMLAHHLRAKACRDYGERVQFSVFEIEVDPAQCVRLKARPESIINSEVDSLRSPCLGRRTTPIFNGAPCLILPSAQHITGDNSPIDRSSNPAVTCR